MRCCVFVFCHTEVCSLMLISTQSGSKIGSKSKNFLSPSRVNPSKLGVAPLAQLAEQVTLNHWVAGSIPARCRISWLIDVFLRDRHLAANAKRAAGDLQSGRGLFALVFVEIDAALHPAYGFFVKSPGDDVARAQVFFDVKLQDLIQNFVRRQGVLVFLVRL